MMPIPESESPSQATVTTLPLSLRQMLRSACRLICHE